MALQEGKPIWVESLLNATEWKQMSKKYSNTYKRDAPVDFFKGEMEWRANMGSSLTANEIKIINTRLDAVLREAGLK